jgi:hypothetical protein
MQLQMNLEVEGVEPQRIWEMYLTHGHVNGRTVLVILTLNIFIFYGTIYCLDKLQY